MANDHPVGASGAEMDRRLEQALRESEARYRSLFEGMAEAFFLVELVQDDDGTVTDLVYLEQNSAAETMSGVDVRGRRLTDVNPDFEPFWIDCVAEVHRTGEAQHFERLDRWTSRWHRYHVFPAEPERRRIGILIEDIHDRVGLEETLRESEARYRSIIASMADGFYLCEAIFDADGSCVDLLYHDENDAAIQMTGQSFKGKRLSELGAYEPYWYKIFGDTAKTGTPHREEMYAAPDKIWYEFQTFKPPTAKENQLAVVFHNVNDRRALRESEERQAFLLELTDTLRPLADPAMIQHEAMRLLGQKLGVSRAQYYIADETGEYLSSSGGYTDGVPAAVGDFRLIEFGQYAYDGFHAGQTQVVCDARSDPRISEEVLRSYETVDFLAYIGVPFVQRGRLLGTIAVHQTGPRQWTDAERLLVEETAQRAGVAVEQARAEAALRESETKFRAVFETMNEACCLFDLIYDDDGRPVDWIILEANPGYEKQSGLKNVVGRLASEFMPGTEPYWIEMFGRVAETGEGEHIEKWHEPTGRWIHSSTARVGGPGSKRLASVFFDITERKRAERALREEQERQKLLLAELQHRVRNTLAVIKSIVRRTAANADSVESLEQHLDGRLNAFARTQAYVTRDPEGGVDLEMIVRDELLAHAARDSKDFSIKGPSMRLTAEVAETLGLAVHELTSNAIKHGALSSDGNKIDVSWSVKGTGDKRRLNFRWREKLAGRNLEKPSRYGFGSELLERVMSYELDAEPVVEFKPDGLSYTVTIPLPP